MEWLQSNWIWIALGVAFVAMQVFGHGGHGLGHHGHTRYGRRDRASTSDGPGAPVDHDHAPATTGIVANSNDPLRRDATDHAGHGSSPTPVNTTRNRHGC